MAHTGSDAVVAETANMNKKITEADSGMLTLHMRLTERVLATKTEQLGAQHCSQAIATSCSMSQAESVLALRLNMTSNPFKSLG